AGRVSFWERRSNFAGFASRDVTVAVAVATAIAVSLTHTSARRLVGLGSPVSTESPYRKDSPSRRSQHARPALVSLDESRPGGTRHVLASRTGPRGTIAGLLRS
ncbi:hypothetical protein BHE74_00045506, partial [Ensete ventricosum]